MTGKKTFLAFARAGLAVTAMALLPGPAAGEGPVAPADPDTLSYPARLEAYDRSQPENDDRRRACIAQRLNAMEEPWEENVRFLERLGANAIWSGAGAEAREYYNRHGINILTSGSPVGRAMRRDWRDGFPDSEDSFRFNQSRYLLSAPHEAGEGPLAIDPAVFATGRTAEELLAEIGAGFSHPHDAHYRLFPADQPGPWGRRGAGPHRLPDDHRPDQRGDTDQTWAVYDVTAGRRLAPDEWTIQPEPFRVIIPEPVPGHDYRTGGLFIRTSAYDLFYPEVRREILAGPQVAGRLAERTENIFRPTSLGSSFSPAIPMGTGRFRLWWTTTNSVQPDAQQAFTRDTGIVFDPDWWIDGGRFGGISYPPPRERVAWMRWYRQHVEQFAAELAAHAHANDIPVRVFWGDNWIGMEPYAGFFDRVPIDQVTKPVRTGADVRLVMDIPAAVARTVRVGGWLSDFGFEEENQAGVRDGFRVLWSRMMRGMLFRFPDGLEWGGRRMQRTFMHEGPLLAWLGHANREFRLLHRLINGEEVFRHDLNVYVITAWGRLRPWPTWGYSEMKNESLGVFEHLVDLPVNIRFLGLDELAEHGVPPDAHVLLNLGEPESAWSGGFYWNDPRTAGAIEAFVRAGGGLVGIDAPSHRHDADGQPHWALADLFGLEGTGATDEGARRGVFSLNDLYRLDLLPGYLASWQAPLVKTGDGHWITAPFPAGIGTWRANVTVRPTGRDTRLLASGDGRTWAVPLLASNEPGRGRAVYLGGYGADHRYYEILRRALFWAAGRESDLERLYTATPGVFLYAYPEKKLLLVYNQDDEHREARVRFDASLAGITSARVGLEHLFAGDEPMILAAAGLAGEGITLRLEPREIIALQVHGHPGP